MKIGFIDYNLKNFHADKFLSLYRGELKDQNPEVVACYGLVEDASRAWAEQNGVPWCDSAEAVVEKADALVVLSPDNAEYHLPLAKRVFAAGKPVFMDKTFADTYENAVAIAELAARHNTPLFSSSSLRYAVEKEQFFSEWGETPILDCAGVGPGPWDRYGVHTVEPMMAIMGGGVRRIRATGSARLLRVALEWEDGRTGEATVNSMGSGPKRQGWQITVSGETAVGSFAVKDPNFYLNLQRKVLEFFRTGNAPIALAETLAIMAILTRAEESLRSDSWVKISG